MTGEADEIALMWTGLFVGEEVGSFQLLWTAGVDANTKTRDSTDAARERGRAASVQMPAKPRNSCNESPLLSYLSMVQQQHQHHHQIFGRRKS